MRDGYERWHNYAVYHNQDNGEKATKVLNEVIFDLLQEPVERLAELLHTMAGQYTELDMLVLQTIKDKSTINPKKLKSMNALKFTPEQMRNVKLSDGTKEYLVAYKAAEEATNIVYEQVEKLWGGVDQAQEMIKPLFDAYYSLRSEILNLMMKEIDEKLGVLKCTEI